MKKSDHFLRVTRKVRFVNPALTSMQCCMFRPSYFIEKKS